MWNFNCAQDLSSLMVRAAGAGTTLSLHDCSLTEFSKAQSGCNGQLVVEGGAACNAGEFTRTSIIWPTRGQDSVDSPPPEAPVWRPLLMQLPESKMLCSLAALPLQLRVT